MRIPVWFVAATIIVMSLFTGVVLGVGIDRRVLLPRGPIFFHRGMRGPGLPHRLASELGLSPAQSASVDSIMRHRMSQRDSLMAHTWPVMRQLLDSTRYDIERILTPEQRTKFEQLRIMRRRGGDDGPVILRRGDGPPDGPPPPD
jgi:Spy/CpxP family protein refolding chaperone